MALTSFDLTLEGTLHEGTTSEDSAVARAIIGVDELLTSAARALYGYLGDPEVDVRRKEAPGAYEIDLGFRSNFGMARRAALSGVAKFEEPEPAVVMRALGWFVQDLAEPAEADVEEGTMNGLVPFLIAVAGRRFDRIYLVGDTVDVEVGDDMYHITNDAYRLLRHIGVRQGLSDLASALKSAEVSRIVISDRETGDVMMTILPQHYEALRLPEIRDEVLYDETRTMALSLASPVFCNDRFWTFTDGCQTIRAEMKDADFLRIIDNGVFALKSGEILVVKMHVVTTETPTGLVSTYEIVHVLDHRKPNRHIPMPGV